MVILLTGLVLGTLNGVLFENEIIDVFGSEKRYYWLGYWVLGYLTVCYMSMRHVRRMLSEKQSLTMVYKYSNMLLEVLFPGALIVLLINTTGLVIFIDSPAMFLYFPIIILSALHQEFRFSLLISFIAALLYVGTIYWISVSFSEEAISSLSLPINVYFTKAFMMIACGFCAGVIGSLLKTNLIKTLEQMSAKNEIESMFSQHVSKPVMETLKKSRGVSQRQEASILFLDIENFSQYAQSRSPEEVILFQNNFFAPVIEIVNTHGGVVHQIMGDGIMASFGAPLTSVRHAQDAFEASKALFELVSRKEGFGWEEQQVNIRIGLHSGSVITGNIGNEQRKQFSISGTPIIIAARLEQLNKKLETRFLMSMDTFAQLDSEIQHKNHGHTQVKGIDSAVEVVEILL